MTGICDDDSLRAAVEIAVSHNAILADASMLRERISNTGTHTEDAYRAIIASITAENKTLRTDLVQLHKTLDRLAEQKFGSPDDRSGIKVSETRSRLDLALHALSHILILLNPLFKGTGLIELNARELREAFTAGNAVVDNACDSMSLTGVANLAFRSARLSMVALEAAKRLIPDAYPAVSAEFDDRTVFTLAAQAAQASYAAAVVAANEAGETLASDPAEAAVKNHQLFEGTPTKGTA